MISGQNITTFSCQKTNLDLVIDNAESNIRTCFQFNDILVVCLLGTWRYLFKITESRTCGICASCVETVLYLFKQCNTVQELDNDFE